VSEVYVFLGFIGLGGIETMYVKVINELLERKRVVLVERIEGPLAHLLDSRADVIGECSVSRSAKATQSLIRRMEGRPDIVIVSMHPWELVRAALLNREISSAGYRIRGFHLVTHSRAFFFDSRMPLLRHLLRKAFFRAPTASTYFMNLAARDAHRAFWKADLSAYPILTLPLAPSDVKWTPSVSGGLRIVSVGRLVAFKGYNHVASDIVRAFRDSGAEVSWDIWGDGPDRELLEDAIQRAGVEDWVQLRGVLPYEDFDTVVAGYDLFIGMGTALLEAAYLQMPAITAVEGTSDQTYGFLYETPLDSVGDKVAGAPTHRLKDAIASCLSLSETDARAIGQACRKSAIKRSSSVRNVADAIEVSQEWRLDASDERWLNLAKAIVALQKLRRSFAGLRRDGGQA